MKLLCTDLDRTLLPNGEQPESLYARPVLWHLLSTHSVALAYVSGRDLSRVLDAISEYNLQIPDAIVTDVGTGLYTRSGDSWVRSAQWDLLTSKDWNGQDTFSVKSILRDINDLENQEESRQSLHKRSYYFPESADQTRLVETIETRLQQHGIKASAVVSHDPEKKVGLLDVLPRSATKREAIAYLQSLFQLQEDDVLFAGDSGNDVSAICADHPGVLVANADRPTRTAVQDAMEQSAHAHNTYFAQGGLAVAGLDALNGNYSAGIVEALIHFRPQWRAQLQDPTWVAAVLKSGPLPDGRQGSPSA